MTKFINLKKQISCLMEDIKALEQIGLSKNDRKVYLTLIESGVLTIGDLVKKTVLHRSYIHDILAKLIDLGLVGFVTKNNKKYFEAGIPEKTLEILENKEENIKQSKQEIASILPELKKRQSISAVKQEAKIFLGKQGIKAILEDILASKNNFVALGAEGKFKDIFKWYFDNWQKRRIKQKTKYKIIYNETLKGKRPTKEQKLVETRFLPEKYEFPATTIIYKNKVGIITWQANPIAFLLENEQTAKSFTSHFEILWNIAKP